MLLFSFVLFLLITGCDTNNSDPASTDNSDIPADPQGVSAPETSINNIVPTGTFAAAENNPGRIQVNLTGIINPSTQQPIELYYNSENPGSSNIFISEDGTVKGLKVTKVSTGNILNADVVFTVDNSGSMSEEADSVANGIIKFANFLQASGLSVQFGIVGYDGNVNGGINFTNAQNLTNYLNRTVYGSQVTGTSRTYGFSGTDSAALANAAYSFASGVYGENGVVGALFADSNFSWRSGAQRVFVNFTDEPTQPDYNHYWNTALLCDKIGGKATIHTVFSEDTTSYSSYWNADYERPWEMSYCTGGTIKFLDSYATGLDLTNLPVAGALSNSYLVEYAAGSTGTTHSVIITISETNADGKRSYSVSY